MRLFAILGNQRGQLGQLGDDPGDPAEPASPDPAEAPAPVSPGEPSDEGADPAPPASAAPASPEVFLDPKLMPAELLPHWKRMQGTFTKRMQEFKAGREKADAHDRFFSDPAYARQVINTIAPVLGLNVGSTAAPATAAPSRSNGAGDVPADLVKAIEETLTPELQWMAPSLAKAQWVVQQRTVAPLLDKQKETEAAQRSAEYQSLAEELSQTAPTWEEHDKAMSEMLDFLQSARMKHPRWGSKLELLYNLVTGNAAATQKATDRMAAAARARTVTGRPPSETITNLPERVRAAKNDQEAWELAARDAIDRLRQGATTP